MYLVAFFYLNSTKFRKSSFYVLVHKYTYNTYTHYNMPTQSFIPIICSCIPYTYDMNVINFELLRLNLETNIRSNKSYYYIHNLHCTTSYLFRVFPYVIYFIWCLSPNNMETGECSNPISHAFF